MTGTAVGEPRPRPSDWRTDGDPHDPPIWSAHGRLWSRERYLDRGTFTFGDRVGLPGGPSTETTTRPNAITGSSRRRRTGRRSGADPTALASGLAAARPLPGRGRWSQPGRAGANPRSAFADVELFRTRATTARRCRRSRSRTTTAPSAGRCLSTQLLHDRLGQLKRDRQVVRQGAQSRSSPPDPRCSPRRGRTPRGSLKTGRSSKTSSRRTAPK